MLKSKNPDRDRLLVVAAQVAIHGSDTNHAKAKQEEWNKKEAEAQKEASAVFRQEKTVQESVKRTFGVAENIASNPQEVKHLNRAANEKMLTAMRNLASPEFYRERAANNPDLELETVDRNFNKIAELQAEMSEQRKDYESGQGNHLARTAQKFYIDSLHEQIDDLTNQKDAAWNRITTTVRGEFLTPGGEWDQAVTQWQQAHERNITVPTVFDGKGQPVDNEQTIGPDIVSRLATSLYDQLEFSSGERLMTAAQLEEEAKKVPGKLAEPEPPPSPEGLTPPKLTQEQKQAASALVEGFEKLMAVDDPDEAKTSLAMTIKYYQDQGWSPEIITQIASDLFREVARRAVTISPESPLEVGFVKKLLAAWPESVPNSLRTYIKSEAAKLEQKTMPLHTEISFPASPYPREENIPAFLKKRPPAKNPLY